MIILKDVSTTYQKRTKHRHRCPVCSRLIEDGAQVRAQQIKTEKLYPVKGIMRFVTWKFFHMECV